MRTAILMLLTLFSVGLVVGCGSSPSPDDLNISVVLYPSDNEGTFPDPNTDGDQNPTTTKVFDVPVVLRVTILNSSGQKVDVDEVRWSSEFGYFDDNHALRTRVVFSTAGDTTVNVTVTNGGWARTIETALTVNP
jgi:hypothetical protein